MAHANSYPGEIMSEGGETPRGRRLPLVQKLGYAAGGLVDGTALQTLHVFLLFYLTAACGMPPGLAGMAIAAGLVFDAFADPLIGSWSDRCRTRFGRRLPFMLVGLPLVALTLVLMFSLPANLGGNALFIWLTFLSIGFRLSISLFLLPHQALGAELSDDYSERSTIMAIRWAMYMIGGILAVALGFGLFFSGPDGLAQRAQYTPFALALAVLILGGGLVSAISALATRPREHPAPVGKVALTHIFAEVAEVFRNSSFLILFGGCAFFFIGFAINNTLALHANTFFWHLTPAMTQMVTMALFVGLLLGAPLGGPLLARMEKRTVLLIGISGLLITQALPSILRVLGFFPFTGNALGMALAGFALVMGIMTGCTAIAGQSAMADAADEHEYKFGTRREGLFFAALAFISKAATALGALVAGFVLEAINLPTKSLQASASAQLPEHMTNLLGLAYGPGAALLSVAAVIINLRYRIDRKAHAAIIATLTERRRAAAGA